jgi:hypothetical protein
VKALNTACNAKRSCCKGSRVSCPARDRGIRDVSAMADRDEAWMHRVAVGSVDYADAVQVVSEGDGTWWVRTHGAARFDVPDLELYGLIRSQIESASDSARACARTVACRRAQVWR